MPYDMAMDAVPTFAWIGWDDAGAIERVGPEAIVTSFWCVVVPVRAGNSFYRFRTRDGRDAILAGTASEVLVALADYYQVPRLLARARANLINAEGN